MNRGHYTSIIANELRKILKDNYKVYSDHSGKTENCGRLYSVFGQKKSRGTIISNFDILIVHKTDNYIEFIIEIEESSVSPKILVGDALCILLGDKIVFNNIFFHVDCKTKLLIWSYAHKAGKKHEKVKYLNDKITKISKLLQTGNSSIGSIQLILYHNKDNPSEEVLSEIKSYYGII